MSLRWLRSPEAPKMTMLAGAGARDTRAPRSNAVWGSLATRALLVTAMLRSETASCGGHRSSLLAWVLLGRLRGRRGSVSRIPSHANRHLRSPCGGSHAAHGREPGLRAARVRA